MECSRKPKKPSLSSVVNVLDILRSFTYDEPEKGVREVSESLGMSKSVVQRNMATLASEGFLEQDPSTRKYRLGTPFLSLGSIAASNIEVHKIVYPIYKELADKLGETVYLTTLKGTQVDYLYSFKCKAPYKQFLDVGRFNPIHCTSAGKVLIAFHEDEQFIEKVIQKGLKAYTKYTITDPDKFRTELIKVREQGYSVSFDEFGIGGLSFAAPLKDSSGKVNFAISVVSSVNHIKRSDIPYYVEEIKKTAVRIMKVLYELNYKRNW